MVYESAGGWRPSPGPSDKIDACAGGLAVGMMLIREDRWEDGEVALRRAMELMPELPDPYVNLAYMEMRRARPLAGAELYREGDRLRIPTHCFQDRIYLFTLNMIDDIDAQEIFAEHRRFGEWLEGRTQRKIRAHSNSIDADRPLRVGYVSGDFRLHPVMMFIAPLLEEHDAARVQPFFYSNTSGADDVTRDFRQHFAETWREIKDLDDDGVSFDNRGRHRPPCRSYRAYGRQPACRFAQKPAPVQVSWLGYLNTTGLKSMDFRLVDQYTDPVGVADDLHTERLVRLPHSQWAYWPIFEVPIVRSGRAIPRAIVFGSFNQFAKLSDRSLATWGQILARVPEARLRVAGLPPGDIEEYVLRRLERAGIARTRVYGAKGYRCFSICKPSMRSTSPSTRCPTTERRRRWTRYGWEFRWWALPAPGPCRAAPTAS